MSDPIQADSGASRSGLRSPEQVSKHTKGPWVVVPYGDGDSLVVCSDEEGNWRIAFMATTAGSREERIEIRANARLIAAAPDLLEALEDLLSSLEITWRNGFVAVEDVAKEIENARTALAKAKGEA